MRYRLYQDHEGGVWVSDIFEAATERHIVRAVIGGAVFGARRWARTLDGRFVYGLDAHGKVMSKEPS